ncbi:MAG: hypothetical protein JO245_12300 [Pseudolabrys sp.]|nr:hypothetical protein [Pseudolabrys sp.]
MSKDEGSLSATDKPWEKPGQTSQDSAIKPPKNVVEQEKAKKERQSDGAGH